MSGRVGVVAVALVLVPNLALAQSSDSSAPGPEHEVLGARIGTWTVEGEIQINPFGPEGRFSGTTTCEWFEGEFYIVCNGDSEGPGDRRGREMEFFGYNVRTKQYTFYEINNAAQTLPTPDLEVEGNKWRYSGTMDADGREYALRSTTVVSGSQISTLAEMSVDGGPWQTVTVATSTKTE